MLIFRVEGGGGDQRKVTTLKTSEALVLGLVVASGHRRVVVVTREVTTPKMSEALVLGLVVASGHQRVVVASGHQRVVVASGHQRVVVATRERSQPGK